MERINKDGGVAYQCGDGEEVTLTFSNFNTDLRVTCEFEGGGGPQEVGEDGSFTFTLTAPERFLDVFFHFVNASGTGGFYRVELSGSDGGVFQDPPPVRQVGDAVPSRRYAFIL